MSASRSGSGPWWLDLILTGGLAGLATAALLVPGVPRPVEWAAGLPLLVVLPGYAFVAALLPSAPDDAAAGRSPNRGPSPPGWTVRLALAIAASVVIVAIVGIVLSATVGIELAPAVVGIVGLTLVFTLIALIRRVTRSQARRANPLADRGDGGPLVGGSTLQTAATILALAALASAVAFAGANPVGGESYTEFYVLTPDSSGNLTVDDMPETMTAGEGQPLHFAIENEENRSMTYEVVVRAEPSGSTGDGETLDRFETRVDEGERMIVERTVAPTTTGETRLTALLYKDGAPGEPTVENADSSLRLWADVEDGTGT